MDSEYLPATAAARQELVLLHGWGSNREIWRPLLAQVRSWANVTLLDLPGCAPHCQLDPEPLLEQVLENIMACAPATAVYVGWSLGGQMATDIAHRYPHRVSALVTLCSNPSFLERSDWPGMKPSVFDEFLCSFVADPEAGLKRFDSLQASGSRRPRSLMRQLHELRRYQPHNNLATGLRWLADLDQREVPASLSQPQLHILGELDVLVPSALAETLDSALAGIRRARLLRLPEHGHMLPLECPGLLAEAMQEFFDESGVLQPPKNTENILAKRDVANSFSRAARHYDSVAGLQRDVGNRLMRRLDSVQREPATLLDLGCGTGYFCPELKRRFPGAQYIGLDLAQGMVDFARARLPEAGLWLVADAEALPLASNSVDLIFSSLAIQWCHRPHHLFAELARVLRPGGRCVFTSLGPDTLWELRASWAAVDQHQHVNSFLPTAELQTATERLPGISLGLQGEIFRMEYQQVRELLSELKTLGAHNMNSDRPVGLTTRATLQGMLAAYEHWREDGMLPATYDVIFGELEKA
jgi:malonyl-CoA O-methyltransferase